MNRVLLLLVVCVFLSSCNYLESIFKGDQVAKIGREVLYKADIKDLISKDVSAEDSIKIVNQYINSWATKVLLLQKAEDKLSKDSKDVEKELEEYRTSLLVYRYEKMFLEQRLDTLVTARESEAYYNENTSSFIAKNSVVKARYIKISKASPNLSRINALFTSMDMEDLSELEELVYNSAEKYSDFDLKWIRLELIARELMMDITLCEDILDNHNVIQKNDSGYQYMVFVYDRVAPMEEMPYEFCKPNIDNIIISKRKQKLIKDLEFALLQDAVTNNELRIFNK